MLAGSAEPRPSCFRCLRPQSVCVCALLPTLPTRTNVILLQHAREFRNAIGTARMAHLCLPNSQLFVGYEFGDDPRLQAALNNPAAPAALLYPGDDATDVFTAPPAHPITLVVVDGTWSQAKALVRDNPLLQRLPRYAFVAPQPTAYQIRKEPSVELVSTIEALMHVLGALEKNPEPFLALMTPFRAMIELQLEHERQNSTPRRRRLRPRPESPTVARIASAWDRLVCIAGEANTFARMQADNLHAHELVHWVAVRPSDGTWLSQCIAPRGDLGPRTTEHIRMPEAALRAGGTTEELHRAFAEFLRDDDIVCSWGTYSVGLYRQAGGTLGEILDVKTSVASRTKQRVGTIEAFVEANARLAVPGFAHDTPPWAPTNGMPPGRAGARAVAMANLLHQFRAMKRVR